MVTGFLFFRLDKGRRRRVIRALLRDLVSFYTASRFVTKGFASETDAAAVV